MKLRNKKTGLLGELKDFVNDGFIVKVPDGIGVAGYKYDSLSALNEAWEDYKPIEPLIKDEKIRKAVRAWAEMNDIRFIHMCSRIRKENARVVGQNALGRSFTMEISNEYEIRIRFKDYKMCYTVAELCGEDEE